MYSEAINAVSEAAAKKVAYMRENPLGYLIAAMMAGAYVGVGIFLVFAIGGPLAANPATAPWKPLVMGAAFAVALSLVVYAGAELYTGNNMVMPVGWWKGTLSLWRMLQVWLFSWGGNLLGAALLSVLLFHSGAFNTPDISHLVQSVAAKKMTLPWQELFIRGILCNWLVCLATWCTYRMQSESGKLIMIFWCLFAFVAAGFEHSVANMTLLPLAMQQAALPEFAGHINWLGFGHNLLWVSLGNAVGGMFFVGGAYWVASRAGVAKKREAEPEHGHTDLARTSMD